MSEPGISVDGDDLRVGRQPKGNATNGRYRKMWILFEIFIISPDGLSTRHLGGADLAGCRTFRCCLSNILLPRGGVTIAPTRKAQSSRANTHA
jgi:hypothetical protein